MSPSWPRCFVLGINNLGHYISQMSGVPSGIRDEVSRFWNSCFMILIMPDESFGKSDTTFHPAEAIHHFVEGVERCFRLLSCHSRAKHRKRAEMRHGGHDECQSASA